MSMIKNFEAELKAFVIKVLEDLDLYHPPVGTTPTPDAGAGQQPPGGSGGSTITTATAGGVASPSLRGWRDSLDASGGQQPPGSGGASPNTGGGQQPPGITTTHGFLENSATGNLYIDAGRNFPGEVSSKK